MRVNIIMVLQTIGWTRGPQVAFFVEVNLVLGRHYRPYTNVEFPLFVKQWLLYVFLHNEMLMMVTILALIDEFNHLCQVLEDADSSTLVHVSGLHEPDVLLAVLHRKALLGCVSLLQLLESRNQLGHPLILNPRLHQKSCRRGIKLVVSAVFGFRQRIIILFERPYQAGFGPNRSKELKMV